MTNLKLNKQSEIVGKPFVLYQEDPLESYVMWNEATRRQQIGRMNAGNFEIYTDGSWKPAAYGKGWKKQYMRTVVLDKEYTFANVWNPDTRVRADATSRVVKVPFGKSTEDQLQQRIAEEAKRGGDPYKTYFILTSKKTGPLPIDVEYTISFEKLVPASEEAAVAALMAEIKSGFSKRGSSAPSTPRPVPTSAPASFQFTLDNPTPPEDKERIDAMVTNLRESTRAIPKDRLHLYRNSMIGQVSAYFKQNNITSMTAAELVDTFILA